MAASDTTGPPVAGGADATDLPDLDLLAAYRTLRDAGHRPVLFWSGGDHPEARQHILAFDPQEELVVRDGVAVRSGATIPGNPWDALRAFADDAHDRHGPPGLIGGLVGLWSYEAYTLIEPTLPPRTGLHWPQVWLMRPGAWIVQDSLGTRLHGAFAGSLEAALESVNVPAPLRATQTGPWSQSMDADAFQDAVTRLRARVAAGDLFQANIATRWSTPCPHDPVQLFASLRAANPSPFMVLAETPWGAVVSGSPEQLFGIEDGVLRTRPIAGTRPRGDGEDTDREAELLTDPKEQAEHTMLVDLLRNDVARVACPGTVCVPERMSVERYRHVMHLVSRVEGRLRPGLDWLDALRAVFPGGTVTGAPKHRACLRIHEAEPVERGPYTGSFGIVGARGDAQWNILIRTVVVQEGWAHIHAGSGIVMDSDPVREWQETGHKAQALLEAVTGSDRTGDSTRIGSVTRHDAWIPPVPPRQVEARVLLVDHMDSFVYNLADHCATLGAEVQVVRHGPRLRDAFDAWTPTHVILSPGPGHPDEVPRTHDLLDHLEQDHADVPVLGVCLGHQVLGARAGATIKVVPAVHGRPDTVHHDGTGIFHDLPSPFTAARYHSLVVDPETLPAHWRPTAHLQDGTLMAMAHTRLPWTGVQFHPESLCTDLGLELILRFLEEVP